MAEDDRDETTPEGEHPDSPVDFAAMMLGSLRAVMLSKQAGTMDHAETPLGKIRELDREVAKAERGEDHNRILVDNADLLRAQYFRTAEAELQPHVRKEIGKSSSDILAGDPSEWVMYPELAPDDGEFSAYDHGSPEEAAPRRRKITAIRMFSPASGPGGDASGTAADRSEADTAETHDAAPSPEAGVPPEGSPPAGTQPVIVANLSPQDAVLPVEAPRRDGKHVPAYDLDRRTVARRASNLPLFSDLAAEKIQSLHDKSGGRSRYADSMKALVELFTELVGDHPVDTYVGADVQAFIKLMTWWPADTNLRKDYKSARDLIEANRDLRHKPVALKTLRDKYVGQIKTILNSKTTELEYRPPLQGYKFWFPDTAAVSQSAEPLSSAQISAVFEQGVRAGFRDEAILPLLGHLTGRRLGLLIHLKGIDFREKYPGVFVAQTANIVQKDGKWVRRPIKTKASASFFVLHKFLVETGFVEWAMSLGDDFLFPGLMRLEDPSKSGGQYMSRLFKRAGIATGGRKEVFHSLRGGNIEEMRDNGIDARDRKLQAGHQLGEDEHELYGFRVISETRAHRIAEAPLNPLIDFSPYEELDWSSLEGDARKRGRSRRTLPDA